MVARKHLESIFRAQQWEGVDAQPCHGGGSCRAFPRWGRSAGAPQGLGRARCSFCPGPAPAGARRGLRAGPGRAQRDGQRGRRQMALRERPRRESSGPSGTGPRLLHGGLRPRPAGTGSPLSSPLSSRTLGPLMRRTASAQWPDPPSLSCGAQTLSPQ